MRLNLNVVYPSTFFSISHPSLLLFTFFLFYSSCLLLLLVDQVNSNGIHLVEKCVEINGKLICKEEIMVEMAHCVPQNSMELYTCINSHDTLYMTLTSGQEYWLDSNSAIEVTGNADASFMMAILKINTTELEPAILHLGDLNEMQPFFWSSSGVYGTVEMTNIHVKSSGKGRFIGPGWNVSLKNCTLSDYNIVSNENIYGVERQSREYPGTSFIMMGPESSLVIDNTKFLNNVVHSHWSSYNYPSFLIGVYPIEMDGGSRNLTYSITNCDFVNNTIANVDAIHSVNTLFFLGLLTYDENEEWNMIGNRFINNTVYGMGSSFFLFYNSISQGQGTTFLRIQNSFFIQNIVAQNQVQAEKWPEGYITQVDDYIEPASFLLVMYPQSMDSGIPSESTLVNWAGNLTPLDISSSIFIGNSISCTSYFFNYLQPTGSVTIQDSTFTHNNVEDASVLIYYNAIAGNVRLENVNVENLSVQDSSIFLASGFNNDAVYDPYTHGIIAASPNLKILSSKFENIKILGSSKFIDLLMIDGANVEINKSIFISFLLENSTLLSIFQGSKEEIVNVNAFEGNLATTKIITSEFQNMNLQNMSSLFNFIFDKNNNLDVFSSSFKNIFLYDDSETILLYGPGSHHITSNWTFVEFINISSVEFVAEDYIPKEQPHGFVLYSWAINSVFNNCQFRALQTPTAPIYLSGFGSQTNEANIIINVEMNDCVFSDISVSNKIVDGIVGYGALGLYSSDLKLVNASFENIHSDYDIYNYYDSMIEECTWRYCLGSNYQGITNNMDFNCLQANKPTPKYVCPALSPKSNSCNDGYCWDTKYIVLLVLRLCAGIGSLSWIYFAKCRKKTKDQLSKPLRQSAKEINNQTTESLI